MRIKRCVYAKCNSDSRYMHKDYMKGVTFTPFPKPKTNFPGCKKWLERIGRPDFTISRVNSSTYVCSKHFVGGNGPTQSFPHPLPNDKVTVSQNMNAESFPAINITKLLVPCAFKVHVQTLNKPTPGNTVSIFKDKNVETETMEIMVDPSIFEIPEKDKTRIEDKCIGMKNDGTVNGIPQNPNEQSRSCTDHNYNKVDTRCSVNLKDTFIDFSPPANWSVSFTNGVFKIRKLDEESGLLIFSASIDETFKTHYEALRKKVSNEFILSKLPQIIRDQETLLTLIENMEKWKICSGNGEEKFISAFKHRINTLGFRNILSGALHNKNCSLFVLDEKRTRCFFCLKQRRCFQNILNRKQRKNGPTIRHFKTMSKKDLVNSLRKAKYEIVLLSEKLRRLKKRVTKLTNP